jgi:hypothetical protein
MAQEMAPKPAEKPVKETLTVDQIVRLLCVGLKRNLSTVPTSSANRVSTHEQHLLLQGRPRASGGGRHERNGTGTAICDAGLAQ